MLIKLLALSSGPARTPPPKTGGAVLSHRHQEGEAQEIELKLFLASKTAEADSSQRTCQPDIQDETKPSQLFDNKCNWQ